MLDTIKVVVPKKGKAKDETTATIYFDFFWAAFTCTCFDTLLDKKARFSN